MGSTLQITCCSTTEEKPEENNNKSTTSDSTYPTVYTYPALTQDVKKYNAIPRSISDSTIRIVPAN